MFPTLMDSSSNAVNLPGVPQQLANALGLTGAAGLLAAELICSALMLMMFLLPMLLLTRNFMTHLIMGELVLGVCVALAWLPPWLFIIQIILIAGLFSGIFRDWLSGKGGGT